MKPIRERKSLVWLRNSVHAENRKNGVKLRAGPVVAGANLGDIT
jgi:hypothetical protein